MFENFYSNLGAIYAKGLWTKITACSAGYFSFSVSGWWGLKGVSFSGWRYVLKSHIEGSLNKVCMC